MPERTEVATARLAIHLAAPPNWSFVGGDTIIGTVVRQSHLVCADATVAIKLVGRAKSKIVVHQNNNRYEYRGRFHFFGGAAAADVERTIHRGPIHVPPGGDALAWPFSIKIPTSPMMSPVSGSMRRCSLLPMTAEDLARHMLPGTFRSEGTGFSRRSECYVEYYLEASLHRGHGRGHGSSAEVMATLPVLMRHPSTDQPVTNHRLLRKSWPRTVQSHRLLPGQESGQLSFKQKSQKFFGSSKVPRLDFDLQVTVPQIVQLDHPVTIPIQLLAIPKAGTSAGSVELNHVTHQVTLSSIKLTLRSTTTAIAPGTWPSRSHRDERSVSRDLGLERATQRPEEPIVVPFGPGDGPIDTIYPSFTTYNVKHTNSWKWTVVYSVAGETMKLLFDMPVTILPPPESRLRWAEPRQVAIAPPEEPPPPFEPSLADDSKAAGLNKDAKKLETDVGMDGE
ncbi:hypothetical protein DCS_06195 [Drechmeria coniospora]|uniref:Arrestin-like N-terminal domain-containing protein n=1 Tax=Drechmeria coniospora TaxID=98403 RepID=A0A151GAX5_DRECN|nr:hypothetical protein DCS_06195 [Drechmeria coniospora]KYK54238.1 hypothetical protein DCS_06195 [Drechmeria coniospora]